MKRRSFLLGSMATASYISMLPLKALATPVGWDVDEWTIDPQEILEARRQFENEGLIQTTVPQSLWTYETVVKNLSLYLEQQFAAFFLVNTDDNISANKLKFVQAQHMQVIVKKDPSKPLFVRNSAGVIVGYGDNADLWSPIPCSTGPGRPYILTYSGIFRFNHIRSKARLFTDPGAAMSYSMYLDFVYSSGREAGLAIHGNINTEPLGKFRDSQGCVQTSYEDAKKVHLFLMSKEMWSETIPEFNRRERLPNFYMENGVPRSRPGIKALMINFNGYSKPENKVVT